MDNLLDTEKFSSMLKSKRGSRGLRDVAQEIGNLSASTLSRIEQGKIPDIDTFIRICKWLSVSTEEFTLKKELNTEMKSNQEILLTHLKADKTLSSKTILALSHMINMAYENVE
jgi:transcriptional regulator with XRE-family HTH domain